ncbi:MULTISPECIES: hypothetical protein [Sphingobacterium]|uniref:hypothetical protein n=1 Tax=Sphingobacterium TaxID=28453 RepID=UPI00257BEB1A|nr:MULTISPECIES: hypothetical protein [Sphingobacterium]
MKNTQKKLKAKHFRYLTQEHIDDPMKYLIGFFESETSIRDWLADLNTLINAASNAKMNPPRSSTGYLTRKLIEQVELAYVIFRKCKLKTIEQPLKFNKGVSDYWNQLLAIDSSASNIDTAADSISRFFSYESLQQWYSILDDLWISLGDRDKVENYKNNNDIYKKNYCNSNFRDLILNAIECYCTPALVACFGYDSDYHRHHNALQRAKKDHITHSYYIFVAYETLNGELNNLTQFIADMLPNNVSLTLALENSAVFSKQFSKGHPFFLSLLKAGDIWLQNTSMANIDLESIVAPQLNLDYVRQQWKTRYNNARTLYLPYEEYCSAISIEAVYFMLSQALEQVCLGVINTVLQYKPQRVNLTFLMQLCKLIVPDAYFIFCLDHQDQLNAFKNITEAQQEFRYNANYKGNPLTIIELQKRTKTFIERCNQEMESYFEKISSQQLVEQVE